MSRESLGSAGMSAPLSARMNPLPLFFHLDRMLPAHTVQGPLPPSAYQSKHSSRLQTPPDTPGMMFNLGITCPSQVDT